MGKTERSKWAGAHESTWVTNEFQADGNGLTRIECQKPCSRRLSEFRSDPCFFVGPVYSAAAPKKMRLTLPLVKSKMMPP
jgi:hypothetical protein